MKSFYIKSVLLGIGIGIIFTSLVGIIYSAGMSPQMSKLEIMEKAKQYGMVLGSDTIIAADDNKTDGTALEEEEPVPGYNNAVDTPKPIETEGLRENTEKPTDEPAQEVLIKIDPGDTSKVVAEKLYEKGLIDSVDSFENFLKEKNLHGSIQVGDFVIAKGTDKATIARIISEIR
ncbi:MAG TPA: aminodeoxychorismate lyase [Acetivibrio sp.]|nr:aminodeoxychorismate lyase [Acetivibrio sp.]